MAKLKMLSYDITLDLDCLSVTLQALSNYEKKITKILDKLSVQLNNSYTDTEIRGVQSDMKRAVNLITNIQKAKEVLTNSEKKIIN
jgi:hypothetical protein